MILSAQSIIDRSAVLNSNRMIFPFYIEKIICEGMSYGLSAAGYDVRIAQRVCVYRAGTGGLVLASTIEHFALPHDIMMFVKDKSTWARQGVVVQNTVAEPGWRGHLTVEISNHGNEDVVIEAGSPIAQMIFCKLDQPTDRPYVGKYMDQPNRPVPAILET